MSTGFQYDVFLSYSSKDKAIVHPLAERLKQDGIKVWLDDWEIKPGDSIPAKIENGLEQSRILVLCMSANAFGSDWAQMESGTFRFRDPLNKDRRFIPLRLDDAPIKVSLAQCQYVGWLPEVREQGYSKLLEACQSPKKAEMQERQATRKKVECRVLSFGHTDSVRSVALSPDGRRALSGANDNTVRVWDVDSGRCRRVLEGHSNFVSSVAWSPDGRRALSGANDHSMRLWDLDTGYCLWVFIGHSKSIRSVAWSPDGRRALSGANDNTVRVWDVDYGRCIRVFEGHSLFGSSVAWSPDGSRSIFGASDNTVRVWDVDNGYCLRVFEGHSGAVMGVAWSPDGHRALSGANDHTVRVWDADRGHCLRVLRGHSDAVQGVAWGLDGRRALSGANDNTVRVWDVDSGRCLRVLEGHSNFVSSVAWSPDGRRALSGANDNTVRVWDVDSGRCLRVLDGHSRSIRSVAWSPDGHRAISGANDNTVQIWDVDKGGRLRVLEGHSKPVRSVASNLDGRRALSGANDNTVRLWDLDTGRCLHLLEGHFKSVRSVAWSPDNRHALSGADDNTLRLWDTANGLCLRVLEGHSQSVQSVAWSPDGRRALSGANDNTVRLWDVNDGRCLSVLRGHSQFVRSVAWSPDGRRALTAAADSTVRLWDIDTGRCLRVLEGHSQPVSCLAWSPHGQRALSGGNDNTVRLWDLDKGQCLRILEGHSNSVRSVAWSPDGHRAFTGASNGVGRIWNLSEFVSDGPEAEKTATATDLIRDEVLYTNAKVIVVGDPNAGKTALTRRLASGQWQPSGDSTVGTWSTQLKLEDGNHKAGVEREVWLWDFGGQADQRLIHQLFMDRAAAILLLFNADAEDVLPGLRDWQTALRRCLKSEPRTLLVAGRIDTGFKASRAKLKAFAKEHGFDYHETSAKDGTGCADLHATIISGIAWDGMPVITTDRLFKRIKDEILKLRDEGQVLHTFKELREELWSRLPDEPRFPDAILKTVIGLLDGPGIVKELDYGTYVLLAPEWINTYAQAVLRTLRSTEKELGCLPLRAITEGKLIYQSIGRDGIPSEMRRLPAPEERIVLGEMERQLMERGLCLQQGDKLVFPSHCGRDRPALIEHPSVFVSYAVKGYLDDIYATLVVRLADSNAFGLKELWRDGADFLTLEGDHHMGLKLARETAGDGDISVYFGPE